MLLSFPSCPDPTCLLNDIIRNSEVTPWWNQDHAPSQPGTWATKTNKKEQLPKKSSMSKVEWKQHQTLITAASLDQMPSTNKKAFELQEKLDAAREKASALAEQHKIQVEDLDLPVHIADTGDADTDIRVSQMRSVIPKNCRRSWIQCSYIIFCMHLHPNIGGNDIEYTCKLTGVNNNTLVGWLSKPSMVSFWPPLVASIKLADLLSALPKEYQECFNIIDNTSTVSLK
jgi:hypothetical protein